MANPLMAIVQDAIGEGKLRPENYRDAIRVSRDPEVTEYLEGLLDLQDVPTITDKVLDEETLERELKARERRPLSTQFYSGDWNIPLN